MVRRLLYWYVPLAAALIAAAVFARGFYSFERGDTGTPVSLPPPAAAPRAVPTSTVTPIVLGDSLALGTGDEAGLGIGGRLVADLRLRHIPVKNAVNLAVNGARTPDLLALLQSRNVRILLSQSNVVIVSIGGNDLLGENNWRNAPPPDPEAAMNSVRENVTQAVEEIRKASPRARIFIIGLYDPFGSTPFGTRIAPLISDWNAKLVERFANDPNVVIVQTADLFKWHDRLSFDRFHPGDEGYALIARRIADAL